MVFYQLPPRGTRTKDRGMSKDNASAVGGNTSGAATVGGPGGLGTRGLGTSDLQTRIHQMGVFLKENEEQPMVRLARSIELSNMGWSELQRKQILVGAFRVWKEMS